jgi:hypothetical protein
MSVTKNSLTDDDLLLGLSGSEIPDADVDNTDVDGSNSIGTNIIECTKTTKSEVRKVKVLVLLAVLFSMCGAVGVFFYIKYTENKQFEKQYEDDSTKVSFSSCINAL